MTCGSLAEGLELNFVESGVRIQPLEGSLSERVREYKYGSFELTEKAGLVVRQNAFEAEPVEVKIGGEVAHRMYLPEDAVTIRHDLQRDNIAILELEDALKVLDRNIISKSWDAISLPVVVEHIMENRDDPNSVIEETRYTDSDLQDRMAARVRNSFQGGVQEVDSVETAYAVMEPVGDNLVGSFDFDEVTGLEALISVMDTFGLDAWVAINGTLVIGTYPAWGESIGVLDTNDLPKLANYTITETENRVSGVTVNGPFKSSKFDFLEGTVLQADAGGTVTQGKAVVERTDVDGENISVGLKRAESLRALENIAARELLARAMEEVDGTIEFDGYVHPADEQTTLARLSVGDHILINADVPNACESRDITFEGGTFFIESVQQKFNSREGWRIVCRVANVPPAGSIETRSWKYNPRTGERYEEDPIYEGTNEPPDESPLRGGL